MGTSKAGLIFLLLLSLALALPLAQGAIGRRETPRFLVLTPPGNPGPAARAAGGANMLYLPAQLGIDPRSGQVPAEPAREARLVMEGLRAQLTRAGLEMDELVSVTVICTDLGLSGTFDAIYSDYLPDHPMPATVPVAALAHHARFELLAVAVRAPRLPL